MTLLHSTPHSRLLYYAEGRLLEIVFLGFLSSAELRPVFERALDEAARRGVRRWLSDYSQMSAVRQADQDWLVQDFSPRLASRLRGTLRRFAIVVSSDPMNQLFANDVMGRTGHARFWEFEFFSNRADAWAWLMQPLPDETDPDELPIEPLVPR